MGKKAVFFLDNEKINVQSYVDELVLNDFKVIKFEYIDSAWDFLKGKEHIDIIILDIMMPPGKILKDQEVKLGLHSGIKLLDMIKSLKHRKDIPILILSNLGGDPKVNAKVEEYKDKGYKIEYRRKKSCYPLELVQLVKNF